MSSNIKPKDGGLVLDVFVYDTELISIKTSGQQLERRSECGDVTFINLSGATCTINKYPLLAGAAFTFAANRLEYNRTVFKITVGNITGDNLGLYMLKKQYTGETITL